MTMKDKLYWDDPYKLDFEAEIINRADTDKLLGVVLDGTYFYPEGGGQPSDRGHLGKVAVVDVQEVGERIVHYLDRKQAQENEFAVGLKVAGQVDAEFRRQNMRAHTGAHLLFGASRRLFSTLEYAGFDIHGGGGSLYLETEKSITPGLMYKMLEHANGALVDDRAVGTYFVKPDEVASIRGCVYNVELPKDNVRIVEIEEWDVAVCSGTHFARTIEVGPISVVGREAHKKGVTRIDYVVGKAAVSEMVTSERALGEVGVILSSPREQASQAAQRLVDSITEERKRADKLQQQLAAYRIDELIPKGEKLGDVTLVVGAVPDVGQDALRPLVAKAVQERKKILLAVIGRVDDKTFIVAGRSEDVDIDVRQPVTAVAKRHGGGGGGAPNLVSAGGITSHAEDVADDLRSEFQKG